jgi:hypothetical protein
LGKSRNFRPTHLLEKRREFHARAQPGDYDESTHSAIEKLPKNRGLILRVAKTTASGIASVFRRRRREGE